MNDVIQSTARRMVEKEILQAEAARRAGMAESTLSSRMQGRQPFTAWQIEAIADVLQIPPEEWHHYFFDRARATKKPAEKRQLLNRQNGKQI